MISQQVVTDTPTSLLRAIVLLVFLTVLSNSAPSTASEPGQPPNIVLIVADDLGIYDLGCYGRKDHLTPNLDALASRGIRYTSSYCGLSICSASRAALMTGKSPARLHLTTFLPGRPDAPSQKRLNARIQSALPPEERTIAEELKKAGYRTGLFGKWHLGGGESRPSTQGFDVVFEPPTNGQPDSKEGSKQEHAITSHAIDFIRASQSEPFFCYVPHHSPHVRLDATKEALGKHSQAFSPLYAANVESLDKSVGDIVDAVQSSAVSARETLIIFTSDNGGLHVPEIHEEPLTHNTPYRAGKGYLYEGGIRVPLVVASAKNSIGKGLVISEPVSLMDLYPTLLTLAGVNVSNTVGPLDGISLAAHWTQNTPLDENRSFYWNFPHYTNQGSRPAAAIRKGKWKLILSLEDDTTELYDLYADPSESKNLWSSHQEEGQSLAKQLREWLNSVGAQGCDSNPSFDALQFQAIYGKYDSSRLAGSESPQSIQANWKPWRTLMNEAVKGRQPSLKSPASLTLFASEAITHGTKLRYEPEPHKNVLGYWTEVGDWAHWNAQIPSDGTYEVEIQYGCGRGNGGSIASIACGNQVLKWTVRDTGHFQNMIYESIGELELQAGDQQIEVRPLSKTNVAIMDIRKISLRKKPQKSDN